MFAIVASVHAAAALEQRVHDVHHYHHYLPENSSKQTQWCELKGFIW
jgi:hypothetical protein